MNTSPSWVRSIVGTLVVCAVGCGQQARTDRRAAAREAFSSGKAAFEKQDYPTAAEALGTAIAAGGLDADHYCDALVTRATALAHNGDFAAAHADLDRAAQGAPDLAAVHAARAFALRREGKTGDADRAFAEARKINPSIKPIGN